MGIGSGLTRPFKAYYRYTKHALDLPGIKAGGANLRDAYRALRHGPGRPERATDRARALRAARRIYGAASVAVTGLTLAVLAFGEDRHPLGFVFVLGTGGACASGFALLAADAHRRMRR